MSLSSGKRPSGLAILAAVLGLTFIATVQGQSRRDRDDDSGDRVRKLTEIAAQQLTEDVAKAIRDAAKIGVKEPGRAARLLKAALARVEDSSDLIEKQRDVLASKLKTAVKKWSLASEGNASERADREEGKTTSRLKKLAEERGRRESVDDLRKSLRSTSDATKDYKRLQRDKEAGFQQVMRDVEKSSIPNARNITFDLKVWADAAKRKSVNLSKKELSILKTLNSVISVDFKDQKLQDIVEYLQDKTGQTILLDRESLREKEVDYETMVSLKARKISVRALLRKLLNDLGLTYVIKDEMIQVTTMEKAKKMLVVRSYPIGDLVTAGLDARLPPALRALAIQQSAKQVIDLIKQMVDPDSWAGSETGGMGTIAFHLETMTISVKQTAEIHYRLSQFGQ